VGKAGLNYTFSKRCSENLIMILVKIIVGYNYYQKSEKNSPTVAKGETKGWEWHNLFAVDAYLTRL